MSAILLKNDFATLDVFLICRMWFFFCLFFLLIFWHWYFMCLKCLLSFLGRYLKLKKEWERGWKTSKEVWKTLSKPGKYFNKQCQKSLASATLLEVKKLSFWVTWHLCPEVLRWKYGCSTVTLDLMLQCLQNPGHSSARLLAGKCVVIVDGI